MQDSIDIETQNNQFKSLLEASPLAVYTSDQHGHLTFFNQAAVHILGMTPVLGKDLWSGEWKMYFPDGRPMELADSPMAKALHNMARFENEEIVIRRLDNSFKRLLVYSIPTYNETEAFSGTYTTFVDITAKSSYETKQSVLSAIVESSEDAIISKDLNGIISSWNQGAERIFGYTEQEVIGRPVSILIPKPRLKEEDNILSQIRQGNKVKHFETVRVSKTGRLIPISLTVSPIKDMSGKIIGASKIARDITEQVEAQAAIKRNGQNLELLNSIGKVILEKLEVNEVLQQVTDVTTRIAGAAFGAFFYNTFDQEGEAIMLFTLSGAPRHAFESLGMPRHTDLLKPTFSAHQVIRIDDVTKDDRYGKNLPFLGMPDGHMDVKSYLAVPVTSTNGEIIGGLLFGHPQVGRFKAEHEDLIESIASQAAIALDNSRLFEELKAMSDKKDEFIALASHELKTPLTTIKGYLQLLARKKQDRVNALFLGKTLDQVGKLNSLVADLLDVSKIEAGKLQFNLEPFDLRSVLRDVMETFPYTYKTHKIIFHDLLEPAFVYADKQRIEQVINNLLTNAIKYSPNADLVEVSVYKDADVVTVKVKDFGIGLKEEHKRKIFTRFYRAEGVVNVSGLGIGLHLTKEIIDRHNGQIGVESKFGVGSEFYFTLPAYQV
jgi:PAS domain S-box-containing protein